MYRYGYVKGREGGMWRGTWREGFGYMEGKVRICGEKFWIPDPPL
jgi:hypothetical protein